jgi:hypothetical protein
LTGMPSGNDSQAPPGVAKKRGFLNQKVVVAWSFWITSGCVIVAVVSAVLAIWEFTGTDALWRTVATCAVIAAGTAVFSRINAMFGFED